MSESRGWRARRRLRAADARSSRTCVREVMAEADTLVSSGEPLERLLPRLLTSPLAEAIFVGSRENLVGMVSLDDLRSILPELEDLGTLAVATDVMHGDAPFVLPEDNLDLVMHLLGRTPFDHLAK